MINLNVPKNEKIGNYKLDFWRPKYAMLFYSDRDLEPPINKKELLRQVQKNPKKMRLSRTHQFKALDAEVPG